MGKMDGYKVDLKGMSSDTVSYRWQVADDFFSAVQGTEIQRGTLDVALQVKRSSGAYELLFRLAGQVEVACDRCLEPMSQPIDAQCSLRVKMGDGAYDDGEEVTVPEREGSIDVSWYIYEFAALQIPLRHVHPDGQCPNLPNDQTTRLPTDPRWDKLREMAGRKA